MSFQSFLNSVLTFLTAGPPTGGLEVSDTALRFAPSLEDGVFASVRLAPGVFAEGKIKDETAFREALRELRRQILGPKASGKTPVNAVVSMSSINIYSQVFVLPPLEGENLEKAVDLNIKMALPSGAAETYSGWQTLHSPGDSRIEILSAFFDKALADDLVTVLRSERFAPMAIEPRALSIARVIKMAAPDYDARVPVIALSADTAGIDAAIIRSGNLHFDYFHSWQDLGGGNQEISIEMFSATVVRSLQQILNFYNSHWKEPLGKIYVAATGMKDEILKTIAANFSVKAEELILQGLPQPDWFVAAGSAFRGRIPRRDDAELSILGVAAQDLFRQEQLEHFLRFWRLLIPLTLTLVLAAYGGAIVFTKSIQDRLASDPTFTAAPSQEEKDAVVLKQKAAEFNRTVELLAAAEKSAHLKSATLTKLLEITGRRDISIARMVLTDKNTPVSLSGSAPTEEVIRQFREELVITPGFREVNLPLNQIRKEGSSYSFSITFLINS